MPERKRLVAPAVFLGNDALVDTDLHRRSLQALLEQYEDTGAEAVWEGWEEEQLETVGGAFALGVCLTYFGVGLGILRFLAALPFLQVLSKWIYGITPSPVSKGDASNCGTHDGLSL